MNNCHTKYYYRLILMLILLPTFGVATNRGQSTTKNHKFEFTIGATYSTSLIIGDKSELGRTFGLNLVSPLNQQLRLKYGFSLSSLPISRMGQESYSDDYYKQYTVDIKGAYRFIDLHLMVVYNVISTNYVTISALGGAGYAIGISVPGLEYRSEIEGPWYTIVDDGHHLYHGFDPYKSFDNSGYVFNCGFEISRNMLAIEILYQYPLFNLKAAARGLSFSDPGVDLRTMVINIGLHI